MIPIKLRQLVDVSDFAVQYRYESFEGFQDNLDRQDIIKTTGDFVLYVEELLKK